jgi:hypothetical protein
MLSIFIAMIPQNAFVSGEAPMFTKANVVPRKGRPDIEYLFTATYRDFDNDPPVSIQIFIDQEGYDMQEVDPLDTNYTDGKDYSFKKVLSEGTYTFYYSANDGSSNLVSTDAYTLEVTWDAGHYDIIHYFETQVYPGILLILGLFIVLIIILCVVSIALVLQLRKIGKVLEKNREEEKDQ